jgi:hypothetical protein
MIRRPIALEPEAGGGVAVQGRGGSQGRALVAIGQAPAGERRGREMQRVVVLSASTAPSEPTIRRDLARLGDSNSPPAMIQQAPCRSSCVMNREDAMKG